MTYSFETPVSPSNTTYRKIRYRVNCYHVGLGGALHSHFGVGVDTEAGIEDAIRNLVAQLVWVTFSDRFGSEVNMS